MPDPAPGGAQRVQPGAGEVSDTFLADRMAEDWDWGEPVRSDLSVAGVITRFHPQQVAPEVWQRVEAFVRATVSAAQPGAPSIAGLQMTLMAQLAIWVDLVGQPLDPAVVLHPETIERFLVEGCTHLTEGSRINYRTHLRKVGAAVLGPDLFPPKSLPMQRSAVCVPYSQDEVAELVSWVRGLPTAHMRRNARALLAIGLGAGLQSEEIQRLVGTDVHPTGTGVVVEVIGDRGRTVPVLPVWADEVTALAAESGARPFFAPERTRITRRDIIGFIQRCAVDDKARFNVQRLRVTWIVHHLSVGTHLLRLTEAAGVGGGQLVKYLDYATMSHPAAPDPVNGGLRLVPPAEGARL